MRVLYFFIFLLIGASGCSISGLSQSKMKMKTVRLADSVKTYLESDLFMFPDLQKTRYFVDENQLKAMRQLSEHPLYEALKNYVRHFGVENFPRNIGLLWKLGKLSEKYGPPGEALLLYKLILKHHPPNADISEAAERYKWLEKDGPETYVPLDVYYELVAYRKEIDTLRPPHGILLNMGRRVNSVKEDYAPTIGNTDSILLFTSKRMESADRIYNENLFFTKKEGDEWSASKEFPAINTRYNEGSACLSADGKQMFFSRCEAPGSFGNCDLYTAVLVNGVWQDVKNLGPNINSAGWESQPSLNHPGDTLFFASNRPGTFGMSDIYFSAKDKEGKWMPAQNAGPVINTFGNELSPFYHHQSNVLYFSSNGQPVTFGGFDIYKVNLSRGFTEEPKNIGPLVNGTGDEVYFTMDGKSNTLYYARSEAEDRKNLDLFSFPTPMEAQPVASTVLHGVVKDDEGMAQRGIVAVIDLDKGVEVAPKYLREDGSFDFSLINHRRYLIIIQGDEFFRQEEKIVLNGDTSINRIVERMEHKIAFVSLEFEHAKADVLPAMENDLSKLGNFMVDHPKAGLKISGHTDTFGREDANKLLSQERADAIKNFLTDKFKVHPSRIEAVGYGSTRPVVADEKSEADKQINRRVEFEVLRNGLN